jgi:hypothetical protein
MTSSIPDQMLAAQVVEVNDTRVSLQFAVRDIETTIV